MSSLLSLLGADVYYEFFILSSCFFANVSSRNKGIMADKVKNGNIAAQYSMDDEYNQFLEDLKKAMEEGLPGWEAQKRLISYSQKPTEEFIREQKPQKSSVLIWLYPEKGNIYTRLILRADRGGVHGGQVALPGGRYEERDQNLWNTALREAQEEIGLPPEDVRFIGALTSLYVIPSNFMVYPFVGAGRKNVPVTVDNIEVQATIGIDIDMLLDERLKENRMLKRRKTGEVLSTPCYIFHGHVVWGATAMILSEFEELARRALARI